MTESVDPALLAHVEQVLAVRNVDGRVPVEIALRILDDMHDAACRVSAWSCSALRDRGLHRMCRTCYPKESP